MDAQQEAKDRRRQEQRDALAVKANASSREAMLANRIVRISRGREVSQVHNAQRDAIVARLRSRLIAMVAKHDRDAVGGYRA